MNKHVEIGKRLRKWGIGKYGSVGAFASALGIVSEGISPYLSGKARPGNKMQDKLRALGCDIDWLMTGLDKEETNKKFSEMVARISQQELTKGEMEIVAILRTLEIAEPIDFHIYFDYAQAVQDKIKKGTGKSHQYKMVAEPQVKYGVTKKRRK
jgi:transcriptional regulator with XRE-family HTH domain